MPGAFFDEIERILGPLNVESMVLCWDRGPYFRAREFPAYKAHRCEGLTDGEKESLRLFHIQLDRIKEVFGLVMHQRSIELRGLEADDIAASIANCHGGLVFASTRSVLISSDGDWCQLVRPGVDFYRPGKDLFTSNDLLAEYGNRTGFVVAKALAGDSSDNIPGVKGVGMKTAVKYLRGKASKAKTEAIEEFIILGGYARNVNLMKLPHDLTPRIEVELGDYWENDLDEARRLLDAVPEQKTKE
jgi:5'-3' exonuclease